MAVEGAVTSVRAAVVCTVRTVAVCLMAVCRILLEVGLARITTSSNTPSLGGYTGVTGSVSLGS